MPIRRAADREGAGSTKPKEAEAFPRGASLDKASGGRGRSRRMARPISVIVIGALLAGLFAGTAEASVGANGGDGMVGTDGAAGGTKEDPGRRGIVGAYGVRDSVAGGPEGDGGWTGPRS